MVGLFTSLRHIKEMLVMHACDNDRSSHTNFMFNVRRPAAVPEASGVP